MNGVNGCDICPPEKNCTGPTSDPADPHWDGTDGAHPAWWRGQAAGIETACREIDRILADPMRVLSSSGKASEPWQVHANQDRERRGELGMRGSGPRL